MLESRKFTLEDQHVFARLTGDFNPIHLDRAAARRTLAGAPVVHGISNLLWLLDTIARAQPDLKNATSLKVHFGKMLYLEETARAAILNQNERRLKAKVSVGDADVMQIILGFGDVFSSSADPAPRTAEPDILQLDAARNVRLEDMKGQFGRLAFASSVDDISHVFPHAARLIGATRVAALGCSTRLVGMVVPGLHSIFSGLDVRFVEERNASDKIDYDVEAVDEDLRFVRIAIAGPGLTGHVEAFSRPPPTPQPKITDLAGAVESDEFRGSVALVVGGSRGLGELVGKIVAAGGGKVVLTYATGKIDAEAVAKEINDERGNCDVVAYDVTSDPELQLRNLNEIPTHIYFFATPPIFRRRSAIFSPTVFDEFNSYYVTGFHNLVNLAIRKWIPTGQITFFYPSSTAVYERPENMTEYAMSKNAGEILCADLATYTKKLRIVVERLPRLLTDQTASISHVESADALSTMLPIVRNVQRPR